MKTIKIKLNRNLKSVKVITLADLHLGDKNCNIEYVEKLVGKIRDNENIYCVLNGDIFDNAIISSKGDTYEESDSPMRMYEYAVELLTPIKHKILAVTSGNHEDRSKREVGLDLTKMLAMNLGLKDKYCEDGLAIIFLSLGEQANTRETNGSGRTRQVAYTICASHGKRSGTNVGSKVNALKNYELVVTNADIYLGSHTHQASIFPTSSFELDTRNHTVYKRNKLFLSNGSCLDYGGYGEVAMYQPTTLVYPTLELSGTSKLMTAYIEL